MVASDGTLTCNQAVTVTVTDVNEAPSGANTTVGTLQNTTYTFGAGDFGFSDPDAGATMTAVRIDTLPAAGSLTLAGFGPVTAGQLISRADIDAGNLQFTPAANASGAAYASLGFSVSDGSLLDIAPNTITINVGWVNQAPTITSSTSATVAEGISISTVVYTASATDPDPDTITFSLSGADAAAFTVNGATGAVTFNASPDFETKSSYSFNVVASDGTTTTGQAVMLTVTDVAPSITSATSVSVPEGTASSTVVYTAAATDVQGGAVTFNLTGADAAAFTINGATGAVTFNAAPDFETKSSYTFNVVASDGTLTQRPGGHGFGDRRGAGDHLGHERGSARRHRDLHRHLRRGGDRCAGWRGELRPERRRCGGVHDQRRDRRGDLQRLARLRGEELLQLQHRGVRRHADLVASGDGVGDRRGSDDHERHQRLGAGRHGDLDGRVRSGGDRCAGRHVELQRDRRGCGGVHDRRRHRRADVQRFAGLRDQDLLQLQHRRLRWHADLEPGGDDRRDRRGAFDHERDLGDGAGRHGGLDGRLHRGGDRCAGRGGELQPERRRCGGVHDQRRHRRGDLQCLA